MEADELKALCKEYADKRAEWNHLTTLFLNEVDKTKKEEYRKSFDKLDMPDTYQLESAITPHLYDAVIDFCKVNFGLHSQDTHQLLFNY